uniref:DNA-(apurinic or apyrimidinic site) lyase n=1 Tax=Saccoglossus kowalevskii TaxID=10224 RepID=A0ABM0MFT2_SACKO
MPEGPEIHLACRFVNHVCSNRIFSGKVVKSVVSKCDDVSFDCESYTVSASARGKEMQLALHPNSSLLVNKEKKYKTSSGNMTKILFRFGMSGSFHFSSINELHKHAHLKFFTKETPPMVLSFVDTRRFGRWEVNSDWSKDRSPDPMFEYQVFRSNIVMNISNKVFERPICEVLLDQKFFNGIGNYLRAEILYRSGIAPFTKARNVLEGLPEIP